MYDLQQDRAEPVVPRERRFGIDERTATDGEILAAPDSPELQALLEQIRTADVEAVAICFLNSFVNSANEEVVRDFLTREMPQLAVSASYDICREMREFERTSTVALNAAAMPLVAGYLGAITPRVREVLPNARVLLMQSNGGSLTVEAARAYPARVITSGPAGGALAVQRMGKATGYRNLLGVDMGGTSTDISLIENGELRMTTEAEIAQRPVKLPMIEINTIGAGAGSIAWLDEADGLHVGPHSAGSDPGPVAYAKGGTEPTVTDANIVLGRLLTEGFADGRIELDVAASKHVITEKIAKPLGKSLEEAAAGIIRIANANMERAVRVSSAEKGYDPRSITLVAFGGAGPMHAAALAREANIPTVLVPAQPGVFSAVGLVMADISHHFVQTKVLRGEAVSPDNLGSLFNDLERLGREALDADGVAPGARLLQRSCDMRYAGQAYEINVSIDDGPITEQSIAAVAERFHAEHLQRYAHKHADRALEFVNARLSAIGSMSAPEIMKQVDQVGSAEPKSKQQVYFDEANSYVETPVYDRSSLGPGTEFDGPMIVRQLDTTIIVHPGQKVSVDDYANLLISTGVR